MWGCPILVVLTTAPYALAGDTGGATMHLASDDGQIVFGNANPARMRVSCDGVEPGVAWLNSALSPSANAATVGTMSLTVELLNVNPTCINVPIEVPCARHTEHRPALFYFNLTGVNGSATFGPMAAVSQPVTVGGVTLGLQVTMATSLQQGVDTQGLAGACGFDPAAPARCDVRLVTWHGQRGDTTDTRLLPPQLIPWKGLDEGDHISLSPGFFSHLTYAGRLDLLNYDGSCSSCKGYIDGFQDGTYGYVVPASYHGNVMRFSLGDFSTTGTTHLDLTQLNPDLKGFQGGCTDGTYGYLSPYKSSGSAYSGRLVRFNLADFSTSGVQMIDLFAINPAYVGFTGCVIMGAYGYLIPSRYGSMYGHLVRFSTADFTASSVQGVDLTTTSMGGDDSLRGFIGGFTHGSYVYLVPFKGAAGWHGKLVRVHPLAFINAVAYQPGFQPIEVLDLTEADSHLKGFWGGVAVGDYAYLFPYKRASGESMASKLTRVHLPTFTKDGVTVLDLAEVDSKLSGFAGGYTDGVAVYPVPYMYSTVTASGYAPRVSLDDFSPSGVTYLNVKAESSDLTGFRGGFHSGNYGYYIPYGSTSRHGNLARVRLYDV